MKSFKIGVLIWCWSVSLAFADQGKFSVGVTAGQSDWTFESEGEDEDLKGASFGLAARYTIPVGDRAFFGAHMAFTKESANLEDSENIYGYDVKAKFETDWSSDILARFGTDLGGVSPYVAGGLSIAKATLEGSADGREFFNESATHLGWKIALGADLDLTEQLTMFLQAEYADYGKEKYEDENFIVEAEGKQKAIRFGVMFSF